VDFFYRLTPSWIYESIRILSEAIAIGKFTMISWSSVLLESSTAELMLISNVVMMQMEMSELLMRILSERTWNYSATRLSTTFISLGNNSDSEMQMNEFDSDSF